MSLTTAADVDPGTARVPGRFLMCPPTYFAVTYRINDWMDPDLPVDRALAGQQWQNLAATYRGLGHRVHLIDPVSGLPDMVFVTDSGTVVDGVAFGARYRSEHRAPEAEHVMYWFEANGFRQAVRPRFVNEGGGDFLLAGRVILAGTGFRTDGRAHVEASSHLGRRVVTLRLVDPRYYHLNTALGALPTCWGSGTTDPDRVGDLIEGSRPCELGVPTHPATTKARACPTVVQPCSASTASSSNPSRSAPTAPARSW